MRITKACIIACRLTRPGNRHGNRRMTRNSITTMILFMMMFASVQGYCGDGVCELGMEDASWCEDCKCGDSTCDFREQALQWCPEECSSLMYISKQPNGSTIAGMTLSEQPAVQIFAKAGIRSTTSTQVSNITINTDILFLQYSSLHKLVIVYCRRHKNLFYRCYI
jgi:hypothetical protein